MSIDADGTIWSFGEPYSPVDSVEESEDDAECDGDVYTLYMNDSYGDGWHGNLFTIDGDSYTFDTGYAEEADVCLQPGCYDVTLDGGPW